MSINGIPVLHFLNIGNGCFPSVWRASITVGRTESGARARLVLCGFDRFGAALEKELKCVTRRVPLTPPSNGEPRPLFYQDDLERMVGAG